MAANKLVNKAVPILFVFCVAIIGMFFLLGGHANAASEAKYGTAVIPGVSTAPDVSYETPVRVAISDEECKAIIAQTWGSDAAARAHRVAEPDRSITAPFNYATQQNRQTSNYCGYMSEVSGQYGAQGTFNVRFNTTGHQATWIGLGGINEVFQAGIDGMAGYRYAWIQFYPYGAPAYYYPVQQNDVINVSVGRDYLGNWVAIIYDTTSGQYASESWSTVNERTGAWIVEKVYLTSSAPLARSNSATANGGTRAEPHTTSTRVLDTITEPTSRVAAAHKYGPQLFPVVTHSASPATSAKAGFTWQSHQVGAGMPALDSLAHMPSRHIGQEEES